MENMKKYCKICGKINKSSNKDLCQNCYLKKWRKTPKGINSRKKYRKKHKKQRNKYNRMWFKTDKGKKLIKKHRKKWRKTPKGIECRRRNRYKYKEKHKNILLMPNILPKEIEIEYHHLYNDIYNFKSGLWFLIPLPKNIHRSKTATKNRNLDHWTYCALWIKKLYCLDIKKLLKGDI